MKTLTSEKELTIEQRVARLKAELPSAFLPVEKRVEMLAIIDSWEVQRQEIRELRQLVKIGFAYFPEYKELDNNTPINVRMTLGDYHRILAVC